jgi:pyrrolidone-carboxylate peptidase
MRILVYGFGPYKGFPDNVTEKILEKLPSQPNLTKWVFPVRFNRRQFIDVLERRKPEIVIGLGQSTRNRAEIESRATNRKRGGKRNVIKPIRPSGPEFLPVTLNIALGPQVGRSDNAGDYVCNYSMYVILDHLSRNAAQATFTFIHIPHAADLRKVTGLLARAIKKLQLQARKYPKMDSLPVRQCEPHDELPI